ncbi:MAG: beta-propeller fold [Verrucomicrobia bacterium]|nr:MAG: beta-propeller fold [Verrucomicrobiota bacterium]
MKRLQNIPLLKVSLLAAAVAFTPGAVLWAIHPKSAGPDSFELKFKLPAPKPLTPEEELATFKLAPGFHAELVAAEPMVESPVALSWDEKGRLFVCEMRGYMHDVEGAGEDQKIGRVVMLEDTDGDGRMDKRTVFADGLLMPRALVCVNGGLLVSEPPNLWFMKDTDGDGIADAKESIDASYGSAGGQPEHMANSPTWLLDNWIYSANHSKRYRLKDGKFIGEVTGLRGQWGMTQDDFGRQFYNSNSDFLRSNFIPESLARRNPNYTAAAGLGVQVVKDQATWPSHPTPGVNRGYDPKQLREDGTLATATATCGASIYRGSLFPKEYRGNAFIPEPAGNLVKRMILSEKNGLVSGTHALKQTEFWTSTDERFRPVSSYCGPGGALYVVDLYRGIIQHKSFLTHYLVANIKDRDLEMPFNQGRIWRVVPDKAKATPVLLPSESPKLVALLESTDGWTRDTAQRLLVERKDAEVVPALTGLAHKSKLPLARLHALWTLEGMGALAPELVTDFLKDKDSKVRAAAVRVTGRPQVGELVKMVGDPSVDVQIALGFQLSAFPESQEATLTLALSAGAQPLVREAILSGLRGRELETLQALLEKKAKTEPTAMYEALAQAVLSERRKERVKTLLEVIAAQPANGAVQVALLSGASGKVKTGKSGAAVKLLYLDSMPSELATLLEASNASAKPLVAALEARLAWPAKPGVPPPPVIKPLTAEETAWFETGKGVYNSLCVGCHQPTGTGMDGLAPALVNSEWVLGKAEVLPRILLHGLAGPIKVGGQSWNLEMPPLGAALSDEQIAGVLTFIRREWEHNGSPIAPATVAKIRQEYAARVKSWTEEELKELMAPKKAASNGTGADAGAPVAAAKTP